MTTTMPARAVAAILASSLLLSSCADLPDLSGYTAATIDVRQSVAATGGAVRSEIDAAGTALNDNTIKAYGKTFESSWAVTVKAMDSMVNYAESIEAIARSGNQGKESAQAVVTQVKGLVDAVGIALGPAGGILNTVTSTGVSIYGEYAKLEGARKLDEALQKAGPIIEALQGLVAKQIDDARNAFEDSVSAQTQLLSNSEHFGDDVSRDKMLRDHQNTLVLALNARVAATPQNPGAIAALQADLKAIADARAVVTPRLADYQAKLSAIESRHKAGIALLGAAKDAVGAWGSAHTKLVSAVRNRQPVTLASLTAAVEDIRALIKQWREL